MDDGHMEKISEQVYIEQLEGRNSGLVFYVGEKVKLKDGDFRIKSIGKKMIVLEGLPGTRISA